MFESMIGARVGPPASASAPLTTCTFSASAFSMAATLQARQRQLGATHGAANPWKDGAPPARLVV